jgi:hypothetical protein
VTTLGCVLILLGITILLRVRALPRTRAS